MIIESMDVLQIDQYIKTLVQANPETASILAEISKQTGVAINKLFELLPYFGIYNVVVCIMGLFLLITVITLTIMGFKKHILVDCDDVIDVITSYGFMWTLLGGFLGVMGVISFVSNLKSTIYWFASKELWTLWYLMEQFSK